MDDIINIKQIKIVSFTDLGISSYLALQFPIVDLYAQNNGKYEFVFHNSVEVQKAIDDYYHNKALVSPIDYFNSVKNLKGRIYAGR